MTYVTQFLNEMQEPVEQNPAIGQVCFIECLQDGQSQKVIRLKF